MNDELPLIVIAIAGGFSALLVTLNELFDGDVGLVILTLPLWGVVLGAIVLLAVSDEDDETPSIVNNVEPTFEFPPRPGGRR